jgi:putative ABC transport system permease protein
VAGEVARENAMRNPKRTARTGGALLVGVALVAAISVIAASVRDWTRDSVGELFTGDYVVSTTMSAYGGLSPQLADDVAALPGVAAASGVRMGAAHDDTTGDDLLYVAVDPTTADVMFDLDMVDGSIAALTEQGILLDAGQAESRAIEVGDTIDWSFIDGSTRRLVVEGTYRNHDFAGDYVVSQALHELTGVDQLDISVYVAAAAGADPEQLAAGLEAVAADYPNADVQSRADYIDAQAAQFDQLVNLMYALLALAALIALFNIANSLVLSIHERTRELGLLRAVGTTRGQTSTSVIWEGLLVALLGTLLGLVIGTFFGWSISVVGRGFELGAFVIPLVPLAVTGVLAVLGAVLASIRPGWRAAHLDVLRAIASE